MKGTVRWFNNTKGYGYKTLNEGDRVTFKIVQGDKGQQAADVVKDASAPRRTD